MKICLFSIALITIWLPVMATAKSDPLCRPLREFIRSVQPGETRSLEFHTSWGGNFKDSSEPVIFAKRCDHYGYGPAESVCAYLMGYGAVEFSENNLKHALMCLSPKTRIGSDLSFSKTGISLMYDNPDHSNHVALEFNEDSRIGGMVLKVVASGY